MKKLFKNYGCIITMLMGIIGGCIVGAFFPAVKDAEGTMRAVLFKGSAGKLRFRPENGMKVIAHGRITVYERDGQYQLYIEHMQPDGIGALNLAYEQLKEKLANLGLFDKTKKKPIPKFPENVHKNSDNILLFIGKK